MSTPPIAIIDSGGANIASLQFALRRLGQDSVLTTNAAAIRAAARVILPGVGAARNAMHKLRQHGLVDVIRQLTQPVLGVCLGMQLLAEASGEDDVECLGVIPGVAARLPGSPEFPVPNMGWCPTQKTGEDAVLDGVDDGAWFYFVHSYALPVSAITLASAEHVHRFAAVVRQDNFLATQFHPERSSAAGARLLQNFLHWQP